MQLGLIGLGKMGASMVARLRDGDHQVAVWDLSPAVVETIASGDENLLPAADLPDLCRLLPSPRVIWVMVPAGVATRATLDQLGSLLSPGDVVIDGGNSRYTETVEIGERLMQGGIHLLDAGTSGGVWGREQGFCLMVGGDPQAFALAEPIFKTLAPVDGYAHVGPAGSGHYVKMVHNGIEYAMMQAYGEGFELLEEGPFPVDTAQISRLWGQGSVIRSWLLDLAARALKRNPDLHGIKAWVEDSGEGRWAVEEAIRQAVAVPALAQALFARFSSRRPDAFSLRLIAALRDEFGGHGTRSPGEDD
jgi:6-phosphogluconate dehydrogenase